MSNCPWGDLRSLQSCKPQMYISVYLRILMSAVQCIGQDLCPGVSKQLTCHQGVYPCLMEWPTAFWEDHSLYVSRPFLVLQRVRFGDYHHSLVSLHPNMKQCGWTSAWCGETWQGEAHLLLQTQQHRLAMEGTWRSTRDGLITKPEGGKEEEKTNTNV